MTEIFAEEQSDPESEKKGDEIENDEEKISGNPSQTITTTTNEVDEDKQSSVEKNGEVILQEQDNQLHEINSLIDSTSLLPNGRVGDELNIPLVKVQPNGNMIYNDYKYHPNPKLQSNFFFFCACFISVFLCIGILFCISTIFWIKAWGEIFIPLILGPILVILIVCIFLFSLLQRKYKNITFDLSKRQVKIRKFINLFCVELPIQFFSTPCVDFSYIRKFSLEKSGSGKTGRILMVCKDEENNETVFEVSQNKAIARQQILVDELNGILSGFFEEDFQLNENILQVTQQEEEEEEEIE